MCCLPTGTGKTLVAVLWLKRLFETGEVRKALIVEPTRLLVNQTTEYFLQKADIECLPIDGRVPNERRYELWATAELVVATPETTFNDIHCVDMNAVVMDECHHTVGQDAFASDHTMLMLGRLDLSRGKKRRWSGYVLLRGSFPGISPHSDLSRVAEILSEMCSYPSIALRRRKSERLEYFFYPQKGKVLRMENAAKLFDLVDRYR